MKKEELTLDEIREVFSYDPVSGKLFNLRTSREVIPSEYETNPKACFRYNSKVFTVLIHSVCWLLHYGQWPSDIVFHRDFNKTNNKITNLMVINRRDNYKLISAYNNLTKYCDIKAHSKYNDIYLVRHLSNGRLKHEKYEDYGFAKDAAEKLKNNYRRLIIKLGGIPPL